MGVASIPVDLFNPGQVFACLGFLEAAETLIGEAWGGFDWSNDSDARFLLRTPGDTNPVAVVLGFIAGAKLSRWGPIGYSDPLPKKSKRSDAQASADSDGADEAATDRVPLFIADHFPAPSGDRMALPIRFDGGGVGVDIGHWADESSRSNFKLYAGNRSAAGIAASMIHGQLDQKGRVLRRGVTQLWSESPEDLISRPFDVVTPMRGSFNLDPRGAWTAIDAGYSPNDQGHDVSASPVVQLLAAWGLENARPLQFETRKVRYSAWGIELPPCLARVALAGALPAIPCKRFRFELALSGKNKVVTFATLENST